MLFICMFDYNISLSDYPWSFTTDSNVIKWLYIPDFYKKPDPLFLICKLFNVSGNCRKSVVFFKRTNRLYDLC